MTILPVDSREACGMGSWADMASVFQSLKDVGDDGWQLPTCWGMKDCTVFRGGWGLPVLELMFLAKRDNTKWSHPQ